MTDDPLEEIRRVERAVAAAIAEATATAAAAITAARRRAEQSVGEARARGLATAERRYQEGLTRARSEGETIMGDADGRITALRRGAEAHLGAAVDLVMEMVLREDGRRD
jgi:vacuolar-type H+-ATPase subunit H